MENHIALPDELLDQRFVLDIPPDVTKPDAFCRCSMFRKHPVDRLSSTVTLSPPPHKRLGKV